MYKRNGLLLIDLTTLHTKVYTIYYFNIDTINILNNNNKACMLLGGKKIISIANEKTAYLKSQNSKLSKDAKYLDLCNNNTNVNFINYTKIGCPGYLL